MLQIYAEKISGTLVGFWGSDLICSTPLSITLDLEFSGRTERSVAKDFVKTLQV